MIQLMLSNIFENLQGPSRLKRKARDGDPAAKSCSPKVRQSTQDISNPVMDHPDGDDVSNCRVVLEQVNWVEVSTVDNLVYQWMLVPLFHTVTLLFPLPRRFQERYQKKLIKCLHHWPIS